MTLASVLIPAHDKPTTLPLTVDTVLRQSVTELEVIVIGDGVTDPVRDVVAELSRSDERVRFLDFPKGPHHGERYRHDAVLAARGAAVLYLCDDDLLLPDHVADLLALLEEHTLVQSLNGFCRVTGEVELVVGDLADPGSVDLLLDERLQHNFVSITGTAHTRAFYEQAGAHWDTTPPGQWPDHHQFRRMVAHPGFRGATSARMTALQLPTSEDGRDTWTATEREEELARWHRLVTAPGAQARIDKLVRDATSRALLRHGTEVVRLRHDVGVLRADEAIWQRDEAIWRRDEALLRAEVAALRGELDAGRAELERVRRKLRRARRRLREAEGRQAPGSPT
jgi:glycosyltransferase involved in cell wall biosynthesis